MKDTKSRKALKDLYKKLLECDKELLVGMIIASFMRRHELEAKIERLEKELGTQRNEEETGNKLS